MVKTIAHLADIHIRKLHRFVEYRKVFKQLYKQLRVVKPDLIYIGGDVVHGKYHGCCASQSLGLGRLGLARGMAMALPGRYRTGRHYPRLLR